MAKKIVKNVFERTGIHILTKPFYSGIGHILLFHRVCPRDENDEFLRRIDMRTSPEYIEETINFFIRHDYKFISLDQMVNHLHKSKIDKKFVVVTFDDGYADNFVYAYPVLKKYNIPFTIYITPNFIEGKAVLWWCLLHKLIFENDNLSFKIDRMHFRFNCLTTSEKIRCISDISSIILDCNDANSLSTIEQIFGPYNNMDLYKETKGLALSWEEVKQLSVDPLVTLGVHSLNHYRLTNLSESAARREIIESREMLEFNIKDKVRHFSYPFGSRNEVERREVLIVKDCGFETGATTRSANIFFAHRNHLQSLPRITMGEEMDTQRLIFLINGLTHCIRNRLKRVVTI